jgi:hypothetical protein
MYLVKHTFMVFLGLAGFLAFEGCGSDSPSNKSVRDAGSCPAQYCPSMGTAVGCCINMQCGLNYGPGCVLASHPDGGVH